MRFKSIAVAAVLIGAAQFASAEDKPITLKFSYWVPAQHPIATKAIVPWAKAVSEASGGTIRFAFFPSAQLGKAEDHYDMVKDGIADIGWINPGFNPGRWPVIGALQIPLLVEDPRSGSAAQTEWYRQYEQSEMPQVKVCFGHQIGPLSLHSRKRIVMPEDLNGMKIRPSSATEAILLRQAGAATVQGAYPETRELIERGVADGTTGVFGSLISFGIDKATTHHLAIPFSVSTYVVAINKAKYDAMSPKQKQAIDANCTPEAAQRFAEPLYDFENGGLKTLIARKDANREVIMPTPQILAAWKARVPAVKAEWSKEVKARGHDPETVYNGLVAALEKRKALVGQGGGQ